MVRRFVWDLGMDEGVNGDGTEGRGGEMSQFNLDTQRCTHYRTAIVGTHTHWLVSG